MTKIVTSNEAELPNITRFTNSQNSVREQDFIALHRGFKNWAAAMAVDYKIFLEIQRGGTESQKAWEKQHPQAEPFDDYVNAFDLVKVYGAGWLRVPGLAYSKNPPFLPGGSVYEKMVSRESKEPALGRVTYTRHTRSSVRRTKSDSVATRILQADASRVFCSTTRS